MSGDNKEEKPQEKKPEKKKMGRPKIQFNADQWRTIESACEIMCTKEEIADLLRISADTLERRIKEETGETFAVYYAQKSANGKRSLRRTQYQTAMNGNTTMLVWLGKQWLGQKDKHEIAGDENSPFVLAYPMPEKKD